MTAELIILGLAFMVIGIALGYLFIFRLKFITDFFEKLRRRRLQKIVEDPLLLKQRLEENGEIVDGGERLEFEIKENAEGKSILNITKIPLKNPPQIENSGNGKIKKR